jgi:hypothetical protein
MVMDGDQPGLGEFGAALWWTDNKDMKCTRATRVSFCSLSLSLHIQSVLAQVLILQQ